MLNEKGVKKLSVRNQKITFWYNSNEENADMKKSHYISVHVSKLKSCWKSRNYGCAGRYLISVNEKERKTVKLP